MSSGACAAKLRGAWLAEGAAPKHDAVIDSIAQPLHGDLALWTELLHLAAPERGELALHTAAHQTRVQLDVGSSGHRALDAGDCACHAHYAPLVFSVGIDLAFSIRI